MSSKRYVCKITSSAGSFLRDFYEERPHEEIMVWLQDRARRSVVQAVMFIPWGRRICFPALFSLSCQLCLCFLSHTLQAAAVWRTTLCFCEEQDNNCHEVQSFTPGWEKESDPSFPGKRGKGITYIMIQTALTLFPLTSYPRQIK